MTAPDVDPVTTALSGNDPDELTGGTGMGRPSVATTKTIWVVDETGGTFWFHEQADAERLLLAEAHDHAAHLTITKVEAPADLDGDDLTAWVLQHVGPITCEVQ